MRRPTASRTHHRKGLFRAPSRIPNASGRKFTHVAVSGPASDTVAALSLGIYALTLKNNSNLCMYPHPNPIPFQSLEQY